MMINIISKIEKMRNHFGWDKTDSKEFLVDALLEEINELKEALSQDEASFKSEVADVLMYAITICIEEGYDIETIISNKIDEVMQREY
ncbi:MAG: MagZ family protein [Erysipelothrix sp.]|nr:MagZ family protein [Erysipelothrix sp.]